ncbi:MAG: iron ABC transporter permease [Coriobacteriales bacterium]|jgi:iron complex transport system permease protein|nr:iron ABC transporter permease [Coriobacteriales bacterium]
MPPKGFAPLIYLVFVVILLAAFVLCVLVGSVSVALPDAMAAIWAAISGGEGPAGSASSIVIDIRLPRVLCAGLVGAALSLAGCALQGLLKNPLADGTTLGVSAGASLGAVIAISFGITISVLPVAGTTVMAALFAFLSLLIILALAYRLDRSLSTDTIILIGVIYGMFISAFISVLIVFAGEQATRIVFWTMGSLSSSSYGSVLLMAVVVAIFGSVLLGLSNELNAFAIGEDNARHIGVNVRRVKVIVLVCVSALVGACVSIGGIIGFVGLVTPHMVRRITGPNHRLLMPASIFAGAVFLMLSDLLARTLFSPRELPIGVVTSIIGAIIFVRIFFSTRQRVR